MLQQLPVQVRDGSGDRIDQEAASLVSVLTGAGGRLNLIVQ